MTALSVLGGTVLAMCLGWSFGVVPLFVLAGPYSSLLARRIARPRFEDPLYRKWTGLFALSCFAPFLLIGLSCIFAFGVFVTNRNFHERYEGSWTIPTPFPEVFGWVALGLVIFVLPLVAGGLYLDRQIRAAQVDAVEVRALRRYLVSATAITVVLLIVTATFLAMDR